MRDLQGSLWEGKSWNREVVSASKRCDARSEKSALYTVGKVNMRQRPVSQVDESHEDSHNSMSHEPSADVIRGAQSQVTRAGQVNPTEPNRRLQRRIGATGLLAAAIGVALGFSGHRADLRWIVYPAIGIAGIGIACIWLAVLIGWRSIARSVRSFFED